MSRIAVFGETLVDLFDTGPVVGGAPFNVARHLAAFGCAPLMLTAIGQDANGTEVQAEFDRYQLRREGLQVLPDRPTGVVDVDTTADGGHQFRIRGECAYDFIGSDAALSAMGALEADAWLYFGTLALRSAVSRSTWRALLAQHVGSIYLDLNWREGHIERDLALEAIAACDILKVNDDELAMVLEWAGHAAGASPESLCQPEGKATVAAFMHTFSLRLLLVTCGADGYVAFAPDGKCLARGRSARPIQLVDTVGAGDSFSAVVLAGLLSGWELSVALERADAFAGHICEVRGAVPATLTDYRYMASTWCTG